MHHESAEYALSSFPLFFQQLQQVDVIVDVNDFQPCNKSKYPTLQTELLDVCFSHFILAANADLNISVYFEYFLVCFFISSSVPFLIVYICPASGFFI
jgi:hypothetical protein